MRLYLLAEMGLLFTIVTALSTPTLAQDCNGNGVLDSLDISNSTSCDNDSDGIPDECIATVVYDFLLDTDPGWTTEGLWAWGTPTGQGGVNYGNPDPSSGFTGSSVYGYNLNGDYAPNTLATHLTSTAIDCTGLSGVKVGFQRWLNVESSWYDHAVFSVSNDNATWTDIWENPNSAEITETAWTYCEYNISTVADNQPTVYLRWTMGATDGGWQFSGWNIDDIQILVDSVAAPADCNDNGVDDVCDITSGVSADCNENGIPDECESWYSGGNGTQAAPWQIGTAQDLIDLGNAPCHYGRHFVMTSDIDMASYPYTAAVIAPDGNSTNQNTFDGTPFTGVFDGDRFVISNLTIDGGNTGDFLGLFGRVEGDGEIRNIGLEGGSITGDYHVGGLVGFNNSKNVSPNLITACYTTGAITGHYYVGGLAGSSLDGNIQLCFSTGTVTASNNMVGGLVGHFHDTGSGTNVMIENCYATGDVTGNLMVGGLVGYKDEGIVRKSYSTGIVTGNGSYAALVGSYGASTTADRLSCYFLDHGVASGGYGNPLTNAEMVLEASFASFDFANSWNISEGQSYPYLTWQAFSADDCNNNGMSDELEVFQGTATDCNGNDVLDVCDITNDPNIDINSNDIPDECETDCNGNNIPDEWDISQGTSTDVNGNGVPDDCETDCNNDDIPDSWEISQGTGDDCNNNGTLDSCELTDGTSFDCNNNGTLDECDITAGTSYNCNGNGIPDECDIASGFSDDCNTNDIPDECDPDCDSDGVPDACETFYSGGDGTLESPWQIATAQDLVNLGNAACHYGSHFILMNDIDMASSGTFTTAIIAPDTIYNTNFDGTPFSGIFDGGGHVIRNLTINSGAGHFRSLFGQISSGSVVRNLGLENCSINGMGYYIGTLVGRNHYGTVESCFATGTVYSTSSYTGGLVGINFGGNVTSCYANVNVAAYSAIGGLVGQNYLGAITDCYAVGLVTRSMGTGTNLGGLVGLQNNATISNSYFLDIAGPDNGAGSPLTDAAMRSQASFVGFDFATDWAIHDGLSYPYLPWQTFSTDDCNTNSVPDELEPDCDNNGIPDGCETDTDGDGIPDACDLDNDNDGVPDTTDNCPNTVPGATVDVDGCPAAIPADFDNDGDVDQNDVETFQACASGPNVSLDEGCEGKDFDSDNDIDQSDFGIVQRCISGENNPADPTCAN